MGTVLDLQGWGSIMEKVAYELQPQLQVFPSCQCFTHPTSLHHGQLHPSHQKMSKSLIRRWQMSVDTGHVWKRLWGFGHQMKLTFPD